MPRLDDEERYGDEEYANDEIDVEEGGDEEVLEDEESLDEEHATRGRRGNRADRGAAFKGLMEESGLTESDRRQIRKNQRELLKDIEEHDALGVDEARERNNELYKSVCYTREAVLDGENLIVIANKAKKETDRMIQVPRYDADKLAMKLVQKCRASSSSRGGGSDTYFDWLTLGIEAGICFNSIPSHVTFLNGPLTDESELQVKQRRAHAPRQKDDKDAEEVKPEDINGNTKRDADQLTAGEKTMAQMNGRLRKKVDEFYRENKRKLQDEYGEEIPTKLRKRLKKEGAMVDAVQFLWNPNSFTQTVENIFHFSFLLKNAKATIGVREGNKFEELEDRENHASFSFGQPGPVVRYTNEEKQGNRPLPTQAILSLTMKDWRELRDAFNVEKGDMPHRTGSKFAKTSREPQS